MIVTRKMKDAVITLVHAQPGFSTRSWVVFYPNGYEIDCSGFDFEIVKDHATALEFYNKLKSPDNYGDAAMMAVASCY